MREITQAQLRSMYDEENSLKFNPELFNRDENLIIDQLKKIILSCERDNNFTLKVTGFEIVDDYATVQQIMYNYSESMKKGKNKKKINSYEFVNLKDTDMKLLIVHYMIKVKDEVEYLSSIICIPIVVDKYYFRIGGNFYSAMYQVVDGSTYNSTTSKSKSDSVILKTIFMPIRIYRYTRDIETTRDEEPIKITYYTATIFNKSFGAFKYILAKYGLYGTFKYMGIDTITISKDDPLDDDLYTFKANKEVYISVPKFVFDGDTVVQSLVCTIYLSITKTTRFETVFTNQYWVESLGGEFNNYTVEKGESLLFSLEGIYDKITQENIHLPEEEKKDIYSILKWMIKEFSYLKNKDNLDISTKRINYAEYIASLYAMKLATVVHKLSDSGNKIKKKTIITMLNSIKPSYLLDSMTKCKLINYKNTVNDLDSLTAIKYTLKRIKGMNEKKESSVPQIYRYVHHSHLGRFDLDQLGSLYSSNRVKKTSLTAGTY